MTKSPFLWCVPSALLAVSCVKSDQSPTDAREAYTMASPSDGRENESTHGAATESADGWRRIDARKFSFLLPDDVKEVPVQGIDSLVGQYAGAEMAVSFDYGWYSNSLPRSDDKQGFTSEETEIGGKAVRIVTFMRPDDSDDFSHVVGVHFPTVSTKGPHRKKKLTLLVRYSKAAERPTALRIVRSIQF